MIPGIKNNYDREIDGQLTFYGVLIDYYNEISNDWNDDTKEEYGKHYDLLILPHFVNNPLKYYNDVSYFNQVISYIKQNGTIRNKEATYSDERLQHFRFLMRTVVETAAKHGICDDVLWGTQYKDNEKTTDLPADRDKKLRLDHRLYLTTSEMLRILNDIFVDIQQSGVKFALLLMCIFGLRNKEACGVWFEDIMEIPGHAGHYVIVIHSSTKGRTRFRKLGGKTDNMYRMIPIPPIVYEFLMKRKKYIQSFVDAKNESLPKRKHYKIERMPIACNGENFWEACTSAQVTAAGRDLFRRINYSEMAFLLADEESEFDASGYRNQKAPTAYIFRREFCTSLYAMGFTPEEIQYLMGHKINNPEFSRQHFRNSDILNGLYNRLIRRPLTCCHSKAETICASEQRMTIEDATEAIISIPCDGQRYRVRIYNKHLCDPPTINITIPNTTIVKGSIEQQATASKQAKTVSVLKDWCKTYNRISESANNESNHEADPE